MLSTAPTRVRSRGVPVALAVGTLAYLAYLVFKPGSPWSVTATNDVLQTVVPLLAAPVCIHWGGRAPAGRARTAWYLMGAACATWGIGQAVWTWYEVVLEQPVPYPGPPDVGYLGAVPLLVAGVLVFPSAAIRPVGRVRAVVDGLITVAAMLFAAYGLFLEDVYRTSTGTTFERGLAVMYPVADIVTVAVVLAVIARRTNRWSGPLPLVGAGLVSLAIADSAFAYMTAKGTYGADPITDIGWPLGFALLAFAAWLPADEERSDARRERGPGLLMTSLPYLPIIPAAVVFVMHSLAGEPLGPIYGILGLTLALLFVVRQLLAVIENRELTEDLEATVRELRARERELQFQAFHDPLTGLANRALFRDRLEHALQQRGDNPVAVLFVDLDDFKTVNDSLGHDAGDHLLVAVGERLRACVRPGDTVARLGGDEFAILLEGSNATSDGPMLAQRVLAGLDVPFRLGTRDIRVAASLGLASGHYARGESVLQDADLAMYAAKARGKARVEVFEAAMRTTAVDRLELANDVGRALEDGELRVHLQPIVDLGNLVVEGHEALVRWDHPTRGLLPPEAFIPFAEETGLIGPLGWWVLERACEQAQRWPDDTGQIGVNLSARQVLDPAAVTIVASVLARTAIDPRRVVLEITESVLVDVERVGARLHELRALGVRLAIDDFGTGYSSLSYLTRLPVDIVKIDRSFIERLGGPPDDEVLVRAMVQLAASLGLRSVAEGVETPLQLQRLRALGCDAAQGYLFGRPQEDPLFDLAGLVALPDGPRRRDAAGE